MFYVWRIIGEAFKLKNTVPTVKHGSGTIILSGVFVVSDTGRSSRNILPLHLKSTATQLKFRHNWTLNQEKHT